MGTPDGKAAVRLQEPVLHVPYVKDPDCSHVRSIFYCPVYYLLLPTRNQKDT
jgi:hypothetical protein